MNPRGETEQGQTCSIGLLSFGAWTRTRAVDAWASIRVLVGATSFWLPFTYVAVVIMLAQWSLHRPPAHLYFLGASPGRLSVPSFDRLSARLEAQFLALGSLPIQIALSRVVMEPQDYISMSVSVEHDSTDSFLLPGLSLHSLSPGLTSFFGDSTVVLGSGKDSLLRLREVLDTGGSVSRQWRDVTIRNLRREITQHMVTHGRHVIRLSGGVRELNFQAQDLALVALDNSPIVFRFISPPNVVDSLNAVSVSEILESGFMEYRGWPNTGFSDLELGSRLGICAEASMRLRDADDRIVFHRDEPQRSLLLAAESFRLAKYWFPVADQVTVVASRPRQLRICTSQQATMDVQTAGSSTAVTLYVHVVTSGFSRVAETHGRLTLGRTKTDIERGDLIDLRGCFEIAMSSGDGPSLTVESCGPAWARVNQEYVNPTRLEGSAMPTIIAIVALVLTPIPWIGRMVWRSLRTNKVSVKQGEPR